MNTRLPFVCAALCALAAALPTRAEKNEFLYGIRSAEIEYQVTTTGRGIDSTGTDIFWVDDSGRKTARLQKRTLTRSKNKDTEMLSLLLEGWIYNLDLRKRTGIRMSLEQAKKMAERMGKGAQGTDEAYARDFVEKNGGHWLAQEQFLGRTCEVFELWGCKTWAYKGLPLKTEGVIAGITTSMVATRIEENVSIPASRFEIPADIKVEDLPDMSDMLGALMGGGSPRPQPQAGAAKPAATKPVTAEAPAAKPAPVAKPAAEVKPAPKPAAKPAAKAASSSVKLTSAQFGEVVSKLHVSGYTAMAPESDGGGHTVNLLDTRGGALGVTILPLSIADGLEKNASLKVDSKFDHEGHAALSGVLSDPAEGDSSILLVRYPERKLALLISATPVKPKEELMQLLAQIDL